MTKKIQPQDLFDKEAIDKRVKAEVCAISKASGKKEDYPDARHCVKCDGKGWLPAFVHRNDGICYNCWGLGFVSRTVTQQLMQGQKFRTEYADAHNKKESK